MKGIIKSVLCLFLVGIMSISVAVPAQAVVEYAEDKIMYKDDGTMYWNGNDTNAVIPELKLKFMDFDIAAEEAISIDFQEGVSDVYLRYMKLNELKYFKIEVPSAGKLKIKTNSILKSYDLLVFKDGATVDFSYYQRNQELLFNAKSAGTYYIAYRRNRDIYATSPSYLSMSPTFIEGDLTSISSYIKAEEEKYIIRKTKTLKVGQSYTFSTKLTKEASKLNCYSSSYMVVDVNKKGKITAKRKGKATVSIFAGEYEYEIKITVK